MKTFEEQGGNTGERDPSRDDLRVAAPTADDALYDPDFGDVAVGGPVQEIYRPGDGLWFAYVDVRSIYNRYGDLIGYMDTDGVTLRNVRNSAPIAHQVGGVFYTPEGDVWGVTSNDSMRTEGASDEECVHCGDEI
ncbi:MAG TPA: hypothetical protein VM870_05915 [Pyrinomonadaceae bacterium]|jgi:hypothetical protein|nr:hypothetical protein [Pyrinomonadaceae bacterium]